MSDGFPDLDDIVMKHGLEGRLEVSAPIRFFVKALNAAPKRYERDGLGIWEAFPVEVKPLGEFVVAAPEQDLDAGSTIWFSKSRVLTESLLAAAICVICEDRHILFATPDGDFVDPNFQEIKKYRSTSVDRVVSERETLDARLTEAVREIQNAVRQGKISSELPLKNKRFRGMRRSYSVDREKVTQDDARAKSGSLEWSFPKLEGKSLGQL